ncbi:MAG: radical SAM protein [Rhizobiales bacterium]|nr:radical SAM protein [Hyphomicrobiales bacterium]
MELPRRPRGDELLPPGEMIRMRESMRTHAQKHDLATVIAYAFDHRTRVLPFVFYDFKVAPAGVRAIGSALADAGFEKTRIVLQQWNKKFSPLQMRIDGRVPDIFMVSSMHLHGSECDRLIRETCQFPTDQRPLIIAGGSRVIYEPWCVFGADADNPWAADVAVTGEEFVLLSLLDVLFSMKAEKETMRQVFLRARDSGALDGIAGLVYARSSKPDGPTEELVDTGVQRLLGDLDELPSMVHGYRLIEPPSKLPTLASHALAADKVGALAPISTTVLTFGCKFRCKYCPIPAYNQSQYRTKSGERIAGEIAEVFDTYGIRIFFGADDNFLNRTERTLDIVEHLARRASQRGDQFDRIRIGTEATVHDTLRMREHLPLIRKAGVNYMWLGVEDITATLVKKGQSEDKTLEAFQVMRENGINPMPMMMHHDKQPLVTFKSNYGLINQMRALRKAGSMSVQITMLTPSAGSQWFVNTYTSGTAFLRVGDSPIVPHILDGNYVIASNHKHPWTRQFNLLAAYTYFYNPVRLVWSLIAPKSWMPLNAFDRAIAREDPQNAPQIGLARKFKRHFTDAMFQAFGIAGLTFTYFRTLRWGIRLMFQPIERASHPPISQFPMRGVSGLPADHALPGTPISADHILHPRPAEKSEERKVVAEMVSR